MLEGTPDELIDDDIPGMFIELLAAPDIEVGIDCIGVLEPPPAIDVELGLIRWPGLLGPMGPAGDVKVDIGEVEALIVSMLCCVIDVGIAIVDLDVVEAAPGRPDELDCDGKPDGVDSILVVLIEATGEHMPKSG